MIDSRIGVEDRIKKAFDLFNSGEQPTIVGACKAAGITFRTFKRWESRMTDKPEAKVSTLAKDWISRPLISREMN